MVSILPGENKWQMLGKAIGQPLQQNLPGAVQRGFQQGQGLNAIDQLQSALKEANGDYTKALPAIMKAYTLNQNLEKSGLAEKLVPLLQREKGTKDFPVGKTNKRGIPTQEEEGKEKPVSVADIVPPKKGMVQDPSGVSNYQMPYGPEDIAQIRNEARQRGYTPEMEERYVNDAS